MQGLLKPAAGSENEVQLFSFVEPRLWLAFDQYDIDVMSTVLDAAWNVLRCNSNEAALPESAAATRTLLAARIIAHACGGDMNYGRLLMHALDGFIGNEPDETDARSLRHGAVQTA